MWQKKNPDLQGFTTALDWANDQAKRFGMDPSTSVYDLHHIQDWIKSAGAAKTDIKQMSDQIIKLAEALQSLHPLGTEGYADEVLMAERDEFTHREDPLDFAEQCTDISGAVPEGWSGNAWTPPVRVRNRYKDDIQRIDINTASVEDLAFKLPSVGAGKSAGMLAERAKRGPFARLQHMLPGHKRHVKSVGHGTLKQILPFLTARPGRWEGRDGGANAA